MIWKQEHLTCKRQNLLLDKRIFSWNSQKIGIYLLNTKPEQLEVRVFFLNDRSQTGSEKEKRERERRNMIQIEICYHLTSKVWKVAPCDVCFQSYL